MGWRQLFDVDDRFDHFCHKRSLSPSICMSKLKNYSGNGHGKY